MIKKIKYWIVIFKTNAVLSLLSKAIGIIVQMDVKDRYCVVSHVLTAKHNTEKLRNKICMDIELYGEVKWDD